MPDDCKKTLEFRTYSRTGPVTRVGSVEKTPKLAPTHRKAETQILAELTTKIDDEISLRNGGTPQCYPCDFLQTREVSKSTDSRNFYHSWTEKFELRDADGIVIKGTAKYRATGKADVETKLFEKTCDEPFGDNREDFRQASFDPETPNIIVVPGYSLRDLWKVLPKEDRVGLEMIDGKKN
ncbi:MAG: hypothetical protein ACTSY1_07915 [Alphaproteobacteria bacterium]